MSLPEREPESLPTLLELLTMPREQRNSWILHLEWETDLAELEEWHEGTISDLAAIDA